MSTKLQRTVSGVNILNEKPLHAALKEWYAQPNDQLEVSLDGFVVDIVRGDLLVEIQTRNFAALKQKLDKLIVHHRLRLVYPIPREKWIVKLAEDGINQLSRRKSPKRGSFEQVFEELVSLPKLLMNPNFSIELLLIEEEESRRYESSRGWRRKGWVTCQRQLLQVVEQRLFQVPADMGSLIPAALAEPFTTANLALAIAKPRQLAQRMVYCLRLMGCITPTGKQGNAILYSRAMNRKPGRRVASRGDKTSLAQAT